MDVNAINAKAKADLFKFAFKARSTVQELTKNVLLEIGYRLVGRSPVGDPTTWDPARWPKGYIPGHFINSWQVGIDQIPTAIPTKINPLGSDSYARLAKLGRWQVGHVFYFVNNLPYAKALEDGHSSQAPMGIVGLTVLEFPQIVRDVQGAYAANKFTPDR